MDTIITDLTGGFKSEQLISEGSGVQLPLLIHFMERVSSPSAHKKVTVLPS